MGDWEIDSTDKSYYYFAFSNLNKGTVVAAHSVKTWGRAGINTLIRNLDTR
jgi:hypothetical protein